MHDRAVIANAANDRKARNKPSDIGRDLIQKMDLSISLKMTKLFKTAYVAQSERPFSDFPALVELQP